MSKKKKGRKKSLREEVEEMWPAWKENKVGVPEKNIVINHPPGTHHTMSREWLNKNGIIGVSKEAPQEVFRAFVRMNAVQPVPGEKFTAFFKEHGRHMVYRTIFGTYDYRTTLKIDSVPFAPMGDKEESDGPQTAAD